MEIKEVKNYLPEKESLKRGMLISLVITLLAVYIGGTVKPAFAQKNPEQVIANLQKQLAEIKELNADIDRRLAKIKEDVGDITNEVRKIIGLGGDGKVKCPQFANDVDTVGLWRLSTDSVAGNTVLDFSQVANNGVLETSLDSIATLAEEGKDYLRLGKDNFVTVPNASELNPHQITLEVCFKRQNLEGGPLVQKAYTSHQAPFYQYFLREDGFGATAVNGEYLAVDSPKNWPGVGEWIYGALTYDGERLKVYANGKLVGEKEASGNLSSYDTPVFVGQSANYESGNFRGFIDTLRISSAARSAEEIERIYETRIISEKEQEAAVEIPPKQVEQPDDNTATPSAQPAESEASPSATPLLTPSPAPSATPSATPPATPSAIPTATASPTQ